MRILTVVALGSFISACNGTAVPHTSSSEGNQCVDPRPQVCTMEYNPVCAVLGDGSSKKYSSPCNACADDAVKRYLPGVCLIDK
ncbi:MAG: hypothetical protein ACI8QT_001015 [Halioglobus sp.]|jgi:hypothetical protein